jgi:hypothetical protein
MEDSQLKFRILDDEMNTSGNRPATRIRSANEYYKLLQQYRTLAGKADIFKIFPDFVSYNREEDTDPEYVLSRVCLESGDFFLRQLLAVDILFDILNNPARRQAIEKIYGFSSNDFIEITGRHDLFSCQLQISVIEQDEQISDLTRSVFERDDLITNLNHVANEQGNYIQIIENSLSWKITRPLRKAFGSASPLGVVGKRTVKFIWWTITLLLPKKLRESSLSKSVEETEKSQITLSSDDNYRATEKCREKSHVSRK